MESSRSDKFQQTGKLPAFENLWKNLLENHNNDVIMSVMASQITSLTIIYSIVFIQGADQRKHQSSASMAFVRGIHRWPVNSPNKGPVTRKMFPFDDVIMWSDLASIFHGSSTGERESLIYKQPTKIRMMMSWTPLLTLCEGNPPVTGGFPTRWTSDEDIWCFFDVSLNEMLNKPTINWWSETPWRSCDITAMCIVNSDDIF